MDSDNALQDIFLWIRISLTTLLMKYFKANQTSMKHSSATN